MISFSRQTNGAFPVDTASKDFAPIASDYIEDVLLAADTLVRVPIPAGAAFVSASFDSDFRMKFGLVGTTYALPTATSTTGVGAALNPAARRIPDSATHVILRAAIACEGSLEFWAI